MVVSIKRTGLILTIKHEAFSNVLINQTNVKLNQ